MGGVKGIVQWAEDEDQPCRQSGSSSGNLKITAVCCASRRRQVSCSREGSHQAENFSLLVSSILPLS